MTVFIPSDHNMTLEFEGRRVHTNRVQLVFARGAIKMHLVGLRYKTNPVTFLNRSFQTRKTARFWKEYLDQVLA